MPSSVRRHGLRYLLDWLKSSPSKSPTQRIIVPHLRVMELEDRRVLSAMPMAHLSAAGDLVLSAGSRANDGQDDVFAIRREGDAIQVSVNGQAAFSGHAADVAEIQIEGSQDRDVFRVDYSGGDPLPPGGAVFHAGGDGVDSADAIVLIGGTLDLPLQSVTHQFIDLGSGRIRVGLGDEANDGASTLSYTGVELITDATNARHRGFEDHRADAGMTLAQGLLGSEPIEITSTSGPRIAFDAPRESLTLVATTIDIQGDLRCLGGVVELRAQRELSFSGTIDVSNPDAGRGGTIVATGEHISLTDGARLDASGASGGGVILLGGGFQGRDPSLHNASTVHVSGGASIQVDALGSGNGGTVVVWSDDQTVFEGNVRARGGADDGDGGLVEVSGKQRLEFRGTADVSAAAGALGTLLLDPTAIVIDEPYAESLVTQLELGNVALWADEIIVQATIDASANQTVGTSLELHAGTITLQNGAGLQTKGGDLLLDGDVVLQSASGILLSTGSAFTGNVRVLGAIAGNGADLTIDSGGGDIVLAATVDGVRDLVLDSGGTTYLSAAMGSQTPLGSLNTDARGATLIGANITTAGGTQIYDDPVVLTHHATLTDMGTTGIFFRDTVDGDANGPWNLTVITLQPLAEIQFDGAVGSRGLIGNLTVANAGRLTIGPDADIAVQGDFTQLGLGAVRAAGDIMTAGGSVSFASSVTLDDDVSIKTGGATGNIVFGKSINGSGSESLTLLAGGDIDFVGAIGAATPLAEIAVLDAHDVTFHGPVTLGSLVQVTGSGTTAFRGNVTTSEAEGIDVTTGTIAIDAVTIAATGGGSARLNAAVDLRGDVSISADGEIRFEGTVDSLVGAGKSLTLWTPGEIVFADAVGAASAGALGALSILHADSVEALDSITAARLVQWSGAGTTTFRGDLTTSAAGGVDITAAAISLYDLAVTTTGGGIVRMNAPLELLGDVSIRAEGGITFESTVVSPALDAKSLSLDSDADILFRDAVGGGAGNELGTLAITSATNVHAGGAIAAASFLATGVGGAITLTDDVATSAPEGIDLSAGAIRLEGLGLVAGGDGKVRLNGAVVLNGDATIEAGSGGIVFTAAATIDGQMGGTDDLALVAHGGGVSFNADIGGKRPIGSLVIAEADDGVIFGGSSGPDAGTVALVRTEGIIDIGAAAPIAVGITLNAGDGNVIAFVTAGGSVRFNGLVELQSDAQVDATAGGSTPGADIRFTRHALIDSEDGENNGLELVAGIDGEVSFNADIGSVVALRRLIVASAYGVAFGNDANLADADVAPLEVVRVEGPPLDPTAFALDIGAAAAIGDGGIRFNAGESGTLSITTSGDKVRLNGAVALQSHVAIDTSDGGIDPGEEIRFTHHAPIDSRAGQRNDLVLNAGSDGMVRFNADLGVTAALGRLIVVDALGVAFGNDAEAAEPDFAPIDEIRVAGHLDPIDADAFAVDIGSANAIGLEGIRFNGGNGNTLALVTSGDKVRLNGAVEHQSHVLIDTSDGDNSWGAEIRFTVNASIDSEPAESNGLTLAAGVSGLASFNADIGTTAALAHLIVTNAQGVALGNPIDMTDPDLGPVGEIWIDGDAPDPGGFAFDIGSEQAIGGDGISLDGGDGGLLSLFTTADRVRFNGAVQLRSDALIDTSGGGIAVEGAAIVFAGTIDGTSGGANENLALISHSGTIEIAGNAGAAVALGTISLQDNEPESTGAVVFRGEVYAQAVETFGRPYAVELLGGGYIVDAVEFLNTAGVTLGDGADDDLTFGNGLTSAASDTRIGGIIRTLDLDMQFGAVRVIADASLATAGGDIAFEGTVDSAAGEAFDLGLTALLGTVQFAADIGAADPLDELVVHSAGTIEFGGDATPVNAVKALGGIDLGRGSAIGEILLNGGPSGLLEMSTAGGQVRFNGRVELQSGASVNSADEGEPAGAEIRFTANSPIDSQPGEFNSLILAAGTDGAVSFNANIGASEALKQLIVTAAADVAFGNDPSVGEPDFAWVDTVRVEGDALAPAAFAIDIGSASAIGNVISLNAGDGNTIQFLTTDDKARFNGAVELQSDVWIDTSDGGGSGAEIRFTLNAPIDSALNESNGLTLTAGTDGIVRFNADIGTTEAPGHLIVTDAWGVVFGEETLPDFAPLSMVRIGGDALSPGVFFFDMGSASVIGDGGIVVNGGHDLDGNPLTLTIASASGAMRFNGAVSLLSDVLIDTSDGDASFGAEIRFTQYAQIDSQDGERNDLTLTAGEGNIEFNANVGETHALDRIEIVRADAGVVFGASDAPEAGGDRAPVDLVRADGGIDVGSHEVITGGIVLNAGVVAGDTQEIRIVTYQADARWNGPVTLASHAAIETSGGDMLFTDDGSIDSQWGEKNSLVLDAGGGSIAFNADIGLQQALLWLEATEADGGVFFGGADAAQEDLGDLGPVRDVVVERGIDLGSQSVIVGGIFFNAGEWGELRVLVESGDGDPATSDARLNGPVWLESDLAIDTSGGVAGIGVTFTADATIDSVSGEHNGLRIAAGPGDVRFYADVGTLLGGAWDSRIGPLVVESSGNIWVSESVLRVDAFGDVIFVSSGDVAIGYAPADGDFPGDPPPLPDVDPPAVETTVVGHTITVRAAGLLTIVDGAALESHTGMVSNAPPLLRPDPDDPNKVLVPGDRVHEIKGRMGGSQTLDGVSLDNWERGINFTLALYWSDYKSTIIPHIQAGDTIFLEVGEDGEILQLEITPGEDGPVGEIFYTLRRHYSLAYLQTVETTVETWIVMSNDENVFLDDSRIVNLNETSTFRGVKVASDLMHPTQPIPEYLSPPPLRPLERAAVLLDRPTIPIEARVVQYEDVRPPSEERGEKLRVWYLVRVLPNGKEDVRHPLSEEVASDPVKLFQMLREMGLPDGKYRIYLEELGFPRRLVYEFYKSGNSLGDPVRERGPGANPMPETVPESSPSADRGKTSALPVPSHGAALVAPCAIPMVSAVAAIATVGMNEQTDVFAAAGASGAADAIGEVKMAVADAGDNATNEPLYGAILALGTGSCHAVPVRPRYREPAPPGSQAIGRLSHVDHRPWRLRVAEVLEQCPEQALSRAARLRRRLPRLR